MSTMVTIMTTITTNAVTAKIVAAIGEISVDSEGRKLDVGGNAVGVNRCAVEIGLMVSGKLTIESKN